MSEAQCHACGRTSQLQYREGRFQCSSRARCEQQQRTNRIHDAYLRELEGDLQR